MSSWDVIQSDALSNDNEQKIMMKIGHSAMMGKKDLRKKATEQTEAIAWMFSNTAACLASNCFLAYDNKTPK